MRGIRCSESINNSMLYLIRFSLLEAFPSKDDYLNWEEWEKHFDSNLQKLRNYRYESNRLLPNPASRKQQYPVEVNHPKPRRVLLKTLIRCIGTSVLGIIVKDALFEGSIFEGDRSGSSSTDQLLVVSESFFNESQMRLQNIINFGIDGLFVQLSLGDSKYVQLTLADRQFIWWTLREFILYASQSKDSQLVVKFLTWFDWMLQSESAQSSEKSKTPTKEVTLNRKAIYPARVKALNTRDQSENVAKSLHSISLTLPPIMQLVVVQELRQLIANINLSPCKQFLFEPFYPGLVLRNLRYSISDDSSNSSSIVMFSSLQMSSPVFENHNVLAAIAQTVYECVFGCKAPMIVCQLYKSVDSQELILVGSLNEVEREIWWHEFWILIEFICSDTGNKCIHEVVDLRQLLRFLDLLLANGSALKGVGNEKCARLQSVILEIGLKLEHCSTSYLRITAASSYIPRVKNCWENNKSVSQHQQLSIEEFVSFFLSGSSDKNKNIVEYVLFEETQQLIDFMYTPSCIRFRGVDIEKVVALGLYQSAELQNVLRIYRDHNVGLDNSAIDVNTKSGIANSGSIGSGLNAKIRSANNLDALESGDSFHAKQRRSSKKAMLSTLSLQSSDNDMHWEIESTGKSSAFIGDRASRGSFNSNQSLAAIMQALKVSPQLIQAGEMNEIANSAFHSPHGTPSMKKMETLASKDLLRDKIQRTDCGKLHSMFPFPPFRNDGNDYIPSAFSDLIVNLVNATRLAESDILTILHHHLLIRSDLCSWLSDMEDGAEEFSYSSSLSKASQVRDGLPDLKSNEGYYVMLKKHLNLFLSPSSRRIQRVDREAIYGLPLSLKSCGELEVVMATVFASSKDLKMFFLEALYNILDSNPSNVELLVSQSSILLTLLRLFPYLDHLSQDYLSSILSKILSCKMSVECVRKLIDISLNSNMDVSVALKALFVLGKAAESVSPKNFVNFNIRNCLHSNLLLPPIVNVLQPFSAEVSIMCWFRLTKMSDYYASSLLQMYSYERKIAFNVFFRSIFIDNPNLDGAKRNLQLCVSINDFSGGSYRNKTKMAEEGNDVDQACWTSAIASVLKLDEGEAIHDIAYGEQSTAYGFDNEHYERTKDSTSVLALTLSSFAFPDIVVDCPFVELDNWHLLQIDVSQTTIDCLIDGKRQTVLAFSPFGYSAPNTNFDCTLSDKLTTLMQTMEKCSKENPLEVCVGGLEYEKEVAIQIRSLCCEKNLNRQNESIARNALKLVHAIEDSIGGFCGHVSDLAVFEHHCDSYAVTQTIQEGPLSGLKHFKQRISTAILQPDISTLSIMLDSFGKGEISKKSNVGGQIYLQKRASNTWKLSLDIRGGKSFVIHNLDTNTNVATGDSNHNVKSYSESTILQSYQSLQFHAIDRLSTSLFALGGFKVLFPLFVQDAARALAVLRLLGGIISNADDYQQFKVENVDKVLLYLISNLPELQNIDICQALFDCVVSQNHTSLLSRSGYGTPRDSYDLIYRTDMLQLVLDVVISSRNNFSLAKSVIDWLKGILDESPENVSKFMKLPGLPPLLVLFSSWGFNQVNELSISATLNTPTVKFPMKSSQDPDRKRVSFLDRHSLAGEVSESASQAHSVATQQIKPIDLDIKPVFEGLAQNLSSLAEEEALSLQAYKLQTSCYRLLRVLMYGTAIDNFVPVSGDNSTLLRSSEFQGAQVTFLFLCGVQSAR